MVSEKSVRPRAEASAVSVESHLHRFAGTEGSQGKRAVGVQGPRERGSCFHPGCSSVGLPAFQVGLQGAQRHVGQVVDLTLVDAGFHGEHLPGELRQRFTEAIR